MGREESSLASFQFSFRTEFKNLNLDSIKAQFRAVLCSFGIYG